MFLLSSPDEESSPLSLCSLQQLQVSKCTCPGAAEESASCPADTLQQGECFTFCRSILFHLGTKHTKAFQCTPLPEVKVLCWVSRVECTYVSTTNYHVRDLEIVQVTAGLVKIFGDDYLYLYCIPSTV